MLLSDLFKNAPQINIQQLSCDSRLPMMDCVFFCVKGIKYNGHEFIDEAIKNGANVIVYSDEIDTNRKAIFIKVNDVTKTLIKVSNIFYNFNAHKLETYVVSGCYGRSSVTSILNQFISLFKSCASIGTFGINYGDEHLLCNQPTLTILDNQKYINEIVNSGCLACTFEANALSLSYSKLDMLSPSCFIYTNTYQNSSDYKECFDYVEKIKRYLYTLDNSTYVILNKDDSSFNELYKASGLNKISYGFNENSDFIISDVQIRHNCSFFKIKYCDKTYMINTPLIGMNNVYNLTSAIAAMYVKGYDIAKVINYANSLLPAEGVLQKIDNRFYNIYIDCARNFESYARLFEFAESIKKNNKIVTVASIRYSDNEYQLKQIASLCKKYSDLTIFTESDFKNDNIDDYFEEIKSYMDNKNSLVVENREIAIEQAISLLNVDDILLVIGKGNEKFIIKPIQRVSYEGDAYIVKKYITNIDI